MIYLLAQITADDIAREAARLQRNFEFLSYGLTAAWIILVVYVLMLLARQKKLRREIASLRAMLEDKKPSIS
jgi:CcmD family protein